MEQRLLFGCLGQGADRRGVVLPAVTLLALLLRRGGTSHHNLHASSAGSYKRQQRLGHLAGTTTDGSSLVITRQVVDLQQRQGIVTTTDHHAIALLLQLGKAESRQLVCQEVSTGDVSVGQTAHLKHRITVTQVLRYLSVLFAAYHLNSLFQLYQPVGFRLPEGLQ